VTREITYLAALHEAIQEEMRRDPRVVMLGEDIRDSIYGFTRGLVEEFGEKRVVNMPVSEEGFTGMAIGAAMSGLRPVVEYGLPTMPYMSMDPLIDYAMKLRYMTGGQVKIPLTFRVNFGAGPWAGAHHTDNPYPMLLNAGFKVVTPSTPYDAKGLMKSAIREDDPVFVFTPGFLFGTKGEVPEEEYTIPLGQGVVRRAGKDVTIVAAGSMVKEALSAAGELALQGIECEVVDPRTLHPLDEGIILTSASKTGRVVIADEANRTCGFASEVAAIIAEKSVESLKAPIKRVTRGGYVVPYSPKLVAAVLPSASAIKETVLKMVPKRATVS
jgi:pyruvate/2-oxoglutarate/acetoin dehydrogenase E1 component